MSNQTINLGKLLSVHPVSPAFMQRAVIIAILSFLFFLAMMFVFYIRQNIGYFLLSTAFLIVYIVTMFSLVLTRKNVLKIYENGLSYNKFTARWDEIETFEVKEISRILGGEKIECKLTKTNGEKTVLSETIHDISGVAQKVSSKIESGTEE